jgi:D-glycero-alpha-D-manno-heptose 1-phosphate guanylyltransferase
MNARRIELCVLAGGFGTRLRSAVADVPKPLAPVAGRPYLDYMIDRWVAQGVNRLVFLLHYQAELIEAFLNEQERVGRWRDCEIQCLREAEPLGTGGSIANATREHLLGPSFLVGNADTWLGTGINELAGSEAPAMAVVRVADVSRYGSAHVSDGLVTAFREKGTEVGAGYINAGLYRLSRAMFERWDGRAYSLERDVFPRLAGERLLNAIPLDTQFIDIGVPDDYFRFCRWIEAGAAGAP